ncbi:unnamed protein product [Gongylonema pulchrum]|uniref:B30.2/SPRY domain-containing protein n=1 Tax=Gongylonema pulchrum TaxID=637853 RepID=A0A183DGT0_9BILA|nr:unnamed protein product [Gongylonema pulchrum]
MVSVKISIRMASMVGASTAVCFSLFLYIAAGKKRVVWDRKLEKGDIVGCSLDLNIPQIHFTVNGKPTSGLFKNFNIDGYFFPVMSLSAKVR